ncbi:mechanosensitive ion channel family protein [Sphingomonas sp. CGMCC 1.13654]|uniref:Small-conductance mechanosensitive channel n=2 Tax=Sphingomonas chungangi TaxID=2683589 RepID=A0A838L6S2_9SPHN|nr:mechanosensitive ion channel family protein [Sphingomonas chungangi]MVW55261.1 mechanosensitive ion channel [Sphingomonas chungangi]
MNLVNILFHRLWEMATEFIKLLPQMAIALLVLVATWAIVRFSRRLAERMLSQTDTRGTLVNLGETLIGVAIWIVGILIAMSIVVPSVTPANILAVLGLGSVAVGFAFKDIFENFLAGILIMLRKPMRIGDMIECQDVAGRVENISLRDTHLRHLSNELVVVPNSFLFKNPVKILTDETQRRYSVTVGVGYDVDLDAAAAVIEKAVRSVEGIDADKRIDVFATEFGDSSMNFTVRWWAGSKPIEMHRTRDGVVRAVKRALDEAGMEIPFPYRTLTFKEALPLTRAKETGDHARPAGDEDDKRE